MEQVLSWLLQILLCDNLYDCVCGEAAIKKCLNCDTVIADLKGDPSTNYGNVLSSNYITQERMALYH